jgi:transcriptional regulator with XRE-family HTH domain
MSLRIARKIARLSQLELAKRSGVDNTLLSRIEHGDRALTSLRFPSVAAIADALNLDPAELFALAAIPDPVRIQGTARRNSRAMRIARPPRRTRRRRSSV